MTSDPVASQLPKEACLKRARLQASSQISGKSLAAFVSLALMLPGCAGDGPTDALPDVIAAGRAAVARECAPCHTARDGFDIAFIGFADADIVRRGVSHVDEATANAIVAYIRSLRVTPIGRTAAPFQPGESVLASDLQFWQRVFGSDGWPDGVTPAALAAIDVRSVSVPLQLPLWSVEDDDTDWLPGEPLAPELLEGAGGALRSALETYHSVRSTAALDEAIARFRAASDAKPDGVCTGEPGASPRARACFEALRWMSSLAAVHLLRAGERRDVPLNVLDLWWDTGKAAQGVFLREPVAQPFEMVSGWLYLAYSFRPARFPDEGGYLEQFLQTGGYPRMAAFVALRRMVADADVHHAQPAQRFIDASIAATLAPSAMRASITQFAFAFLLDRLEHGEALDEAGRAEAVTLVDAMLANVHELPPSLIGQGQRDAIATLRDRLISIMGGA